MIEGPTGGADSLPLFSSSLVPQQTSRQRHNHRNAARRVKHKRREPEWREADREAWRVQPAEPDEMLFRHSGWAKDRARVRAALVANGVRPGRLERFDHCGANCVVEYSPTLNRHRLRGNYCGDRFCLPCCVARSQRYMGKLLALATTDVLKLEFTVRGVEGRPLRESIDHLLDSFLKFRRTRAAKEWLRGGVAFIEIKRGERSGRWHPHLHVIAEGGYLAQKEVSRLWKEATGDSEVVWISRVAPGDDRVRYACKYAGKGWTREVCSDHDSLVECVAALRGRRLVIPFGGWYRADFEVETASATDWSRVDRLTSILRAARAGESWATAVFVSLGWPEAEVRAKVLERRQALPQDPS